MTRTLLRVLPAAAWLALGLAVGLAVSLRPGQTQPIVVGRSSAQRDSSEDLIARLEQEQSVLRQGVDARRKALSEIESEEASRGAMLSQLSKELAVNRALAGLTDIQGPGIIISLADGTRALRAGEKAEAVIVHDYDVRDIMNALWAGGAEAVAINGQRIVFSTSVTCVGPTIVVGDSRVSPPLTILAIGDAASMSRMLSQDPELAQLRSRAQDGAIILTTEARSNLTIPAFSGILTQQFARAGD